MQRVDASIRQARIEDNLPVDQQSLYPPDDACRTSAEMLKRFCSAVTARDVDAARWLNEIDSDALRSWWNLSQRSPSWYVSAGFEPKPDAGRQPIGKRQPLPAGFQRELFERDGYRCRFCAIPVLHKEARKRLTALFPIDFPWQLLGRGADLGKHAAPLALVAVADHVHPHSAGGSDEPDNLVTACQPCNYGRGSLSLAACGVADPFERSPAVPGWDGGRSVLTIPAPIAVTQV